MRRKERKRGGKLTVLQGVLLQSHYEKEELSEKLNEIFLCQCMLKNAIYIYEVARVSTPMLYYAFVKSIASFEMLYYLLVQFSVPMQEILVYS